jgi:hypothetical protein
VKPPETAAGLAIIPVFATIGFYALPPGWQSQLIIQFAPQLLAYLALGVWASQNVDRILKLGLPFTHVYPGLLSGSMTGIALGTVNTGVILYVMPALRMDISFLAQTPHAQVPFWIMVPWLIMTIAMAVELNFRGFLLGRLLVLFGGALQTNHTSATRIRLQVMLPVSISALTFSFDPFMVSTFRDLHWIALWDGLVWGWMWIRMHNLYAVMTAHAVEVAIVYLIVRNVMA